MSARFELVRNVLVVAVLFLGCDDGTPESPVPPPDGLSLTTATGPDVAGTYVAGGESIRFAAHVADGVTEVSLSTLDGWEMMKMRKSGEGEDGFSLSHAGVPLDLNTPVEEQPEAMSFLESDEAQLFGSVWRELDNLGASTKDLASVQAILQYSVHVDEVLGKRLMGDLSTLDVEGSARHGNTCFGYCGPGCISVNTGWSYCFCHDNCCNHNGWGACYSWCHWQWSSWCTQ